VMKCDKTDDHSTAKRRKTETENLYNVSFLALYPF